METTKKGTADSAVFQISRTWLDLMVFGLFVAAALVDLWVPWDGVFLSAVLCLGAYVTAWEISRWLQARGLPVQESIATGLAAVGVGFCWYLGVGYDSNLEVARYVELALALGLTMEALMVSIAAIGILAVRRLEPVKEILLSLAAGAAGGIVVVPGVLLAGPFAVSRLAAPAALMAAFLWFGHGREHLHAAEHRRHAPPFRLTAPLVLSGAGSFVVTVLVARYGTLPPAVLVPAALVSVCGAAAGRLVYDHRLLPRHLTRTELVVPRLAARVCDRLPEFVVASVLLLLAAAFGH